LRFSFGSNGEEDTLFTFGTIITLSSVIDFELPGSGIFLLLTISSSSCEGKDLVYRTILCWI
jgi:hypothetical protein